MKMTILTNPFIFIESFKKVDIIGLKNKPSLRDEDTMQKFKQILKRILQITLLFLFYLYIGGILVFAFDQPNESGYLETHTTDRFYHDTYGPDRVVLIEKRLEALLARLDLIRNAEETLDIAYYTYFDDEAGKLFYHALLEAAERDVKIRLLVDGMYFNLLGVRRAIFALALHDNIDVHIYEPVNFLFPWTLQNRMHDKMMITDNKHAMIGGRNIQYRFFAPDDYPDVITNDLDVLIINTDPDQDQSVIPQMTTYFNQLWNSTYTKRFKLNSWFRRQGIDYKRQLFKFIEVQKKLNPHYFTSVVNWLENSYPTNKVTLIHNPLERFNKEPWIWYDLTRLFESAQSSIYIQSPYVVPTKRMMKLIGELSVEPENIHFFTNSIPVNPNLFGALGYMKRRNELVDKGYTIYEYQGPETIHGKAFMIDDRLSIIGSFNLDARSTYLSTESMVVIDSTEFTSHFKDIVENEYYAKSLLVQKDYTYGPTPAIKPVTMAKAEEKLYELLSILFNWHDYML